MQKYIFTKSMSRLDRAKLYSKIYFEIYGGIGLYKKCVELKKQIDLKKKKYLFKKNENEIIYGLKTVHYKGIEYYLIMHSYSGFDIIFKTSPIDAGFSEFIRVAPNNSKYLYSQHLLDRYNERIHNYKYDNHRDLIKRLIINSGDKSFISVDKNDNTKAIQRISEGFLLGTIDISEKFTIYNTFYDNIEYKDDETKSRAREFQNVKDNLNEKQKVQWDDLVCELSENLITKREFHLKALSMGLIKDKIDF